MVTVPVRVNVYDMYWLNEYASTLGFGIFHSGVEVYGVEYAYGGHQLRCSGIFSNSPQDAEELGENFKFKESIYLGETPLSKRAIEKLVKDLGEEYRGDRYHLISKNCNHFTADFVKQLTGKELPNWVNRLASISGSIPFLERWLPQEWLTPMVLQESFNDSNDSALRTMNYPVEIVEAEEALVVCGSPTTRRKSSTTAKTNGSSWKLFRRNSQISNSAPSSARTTASALPSRIWNSIKSLADD